MKNKTRKRKIPKTELEIELTCEKTLLQQEIRNLQMLLANSLNLTDEILKQHNVLTNQNPHQKNPP